MRKTVRAIFENPEHLTAEDIIESDSLKQLLKVQIPNAIEDAIVRKKIYASIFEINDSNHYVEIHKNHWVSALETCIVWYLDDENYEMCTHIKNMIQTIQSKTLKKISTNNKDEHGV